MPDEDIDFILTRRRPENQISFALQLCAFRYLGRLLEPGEFIPEAMSGFIAAQIGAKPDDLLHTTPNGRTPDMSTLKRFARFMGARCLKASASSRCGLGSIKMQKVHNQAKA